MNESADPSDLQQSVEDEALERVLRLLYSHIIGSQIIAIVAGAFTCVVLWRHVDHAFLITWYLFVLAVVAVRWGLALLYNRRPKETSDARVWERRLFGSLVLVGLVWGVGCWILLPQDSLTHQLFLYGVLLALSGGVVASYSNHSGMVLVTIALLLGPMTLWALFQDSLPLRVMGFFSLIYIGAVNRFTRTSAFLMRRVIQLSQELRIAHNHQRSLARLDPLTELKNRRAFFELSESAFRVAKRYSHPLSVAMFDIDRFKGINDHWGHSGGDDALWQVASLLRGATREADVCGRLGGDEFALLLPNTTADEATAQAERVRIDLKAARLMFEGDEITFSVSCGIAELNPEIDTLEALLSRGDAALYRAKELGRDRVESFLGSDLGSGTE